MKLRSVTIKIDEEIYKRIMNRLPWLSYSSMEDFVSEAVRLRLQDLLRLLPS